MIVVFGSMNVDMVMPVRQFPRPGETVMCTTDYLSRTGGKGANQAVAAARAGASKVAMVGKVGDDAFGRRSIHNLKSQSIWTTGIGVSARPTGCATIVVDNNGANMVMTAPGANLDATSDQLPDEVLHPKNIVLCQLECRHDETFSVLERAHAAGARTILNASPFGMLPEGILGAVTYLIVNEVESHHLAEGLGLATRAAEDIARGVAARAPATTVMVTLEDKGSVAAHGDKAWHQAALGVDVVDTTGAGDAFCGIFAACLLAEKPWFEAWRYASAGASLSCLGLGAQAGMPFLEDIEAVLENVPAPVLLKA